MEFEAAPFFHEVAEGPVRGNAHWVATSDGVRIRVGHWRPETAQGSLLIFPGRTEYIEKYAGMAGAMAERGFATLAIDWRGQGIADRLLDNPLTGHVEHFTDYQKDVSAALRVARALDLPRPWHVLGHSMGRAIGLRAVMEGLPVQSCVFSGPMWGIYMTPLMKPLGWALAHAGPMVGLGTMLPPSTKEHHYVLTNPLENNTLTGDRAQYELMQNQLTAHPELEIGGPSLVWFREALVECKHLAERASPDLPCLTFLGSKEAIVDRKRVHERIEKWKRGQLEVVEGGQHEVAMEVPDMRNAFFEKTAAFLSGTRATSV